MSPKTDKHLGCLLLILCILLGIITFDLILIHILGFSTIGKLTNGFTTLKIKSISGF